MDDSRDIFSGYNLMGEEPENKAMCPRPWKQSGFQILDANNRLVCKILADTPEEKTVAMEIVLTVNQMEKKQACIHALQELILWAAVNSSWAQNGRPGEEPEEHPISQARKAIRELLEDL